MTKKKINYSDLSSKELEILKDKYIDLKVKSMSDYDLKEFAIQNISLQIKNTIGSEEELEAWNEMEEFFKDEFINIIRDIQININSTFSENPNLKNQETKIYAEDKGEDKKLDMWQD